MTMSAKHRMSRVSMYAAFLLLFAGCESGSSGTAIQSADVIILNAKVLTSDNARRIVEAVAVRGGKIAYVGNNTGAMEFIGKETRVVQADGKTLTPGFFDNHTHILFMAMLRPMIVDLYDCKSLDEVRERTVAFAKAHPDLPLIIGFGWFYDYVPGRIPEQAMLDEWIPDRPVWMLAYDAATLWVNSPINDLMLKRNPKACRRMMPRIDEKTGKNTGIYMQSSSFNPFDFLDVEEFGSELKAQMFSEAGRAVAETLAMGVVGVEDLQIYKTFVPWILEFRDQGGLDDLRIRLAFYIDPIDIEDEEGLIADLRWWKETGEKESDQRLTLGTAIKLYIDGVSGNQTAFMSEPYSDAPEKYGYPNWTSEQFKRLLEHIDDFGMQTCTHAVGDAGIPYILDAIEQSANRGMVRDARHRIEHCELPSATDIGRMVKLGVLAGMQPAEFYGDASNEKALGVKRLKAMMPWRSLQEAGVSISFGTDYLAGSIPPINPLYGLLVATTRLNYKGNTDWGPEEAIDLVDAIYHYTLGGAYARKIEGQTGSIEVGKNADLVLFDLDLIAVDSFWLIQQLEAGNLDNFVDWTMAGGRIVYQRDGASL
ncbi:MAG: amidohydrolase [Pseudomonadota bacterium]